MEKDQLILGIDIGGTNTKLGLVDHTGDSIVNMSIHTHADKAVDFFVSTLFVAIDKLKEEAPEGKEVIAIGIGAPNGNYHSGCIELAPNLDWGEKVPIVAMISERSGLPVWLTNDANAAAVGEMKFGVARNFKSFVVLTLGTGFGSGIVLDGKLVYGHDGFAGELGHTTAKLNGRSHTTERFGSTETYVSATGIVRSAFYLMGEMHDDSKLRNYSYEQLEAHNLSKAASKGDAIALEAFKMTGHFLGQQICDTVNLLDIEAAILFGGLANAKDLLLAPTLDYLRHNLTQEQFKNTQVLFSDLSGDNTAVLGSAALALDEFAKQKP